MRKAKADEVRAMIATFRAELALRAKVEAARPRPRRLDAIPPRERSTKPMPPYSGIPMGARRAPSGYTEALLSSEIVRRPLRG